MTWTLAPCARTDVVAAFLKRYNLDLVCRAHQVVEDGCASDTL